MKELARPGVVRVPGGRTTPGDRAQDQKRPDGCDRIGLHNCGHLGRFANHDASHDPCMCCGADRLDPPPEQCLQPTGHSAAVRRP